MLVSPKILLVVSFWPNSPPLLDEDGTPNKGFCLSLLLLDSLPYYFFGKPPKIKPSVLVAAVGFVKLLGAEKIDLFWLAGCPNKPPPLVVPPNSPPVSEDCPKADVPMCGENNDDPAPTPAYLSVFCGSLFVVLLLLLKSPPEIPPNSDVDGGLPWFCWFGSIK